MKAEISVRAASPADAVTIRSFWRQFWPEMHYEAQLESKITTEPDLVLVAIFENEVVGTVIGGYDGWWAWIYRFAVRADLQRQGIGTQLLSKIQANLKAKGAKNTCAIVSPDNSAINALLEKNGFRSPGGAFMGKVLV